MTSPAAYVNSVLLRTPPRRLRPIGLRPAFLLVVFLAADLLLAPLAALAARNPITGVLVGFAIAAGGVLLYSRLVGWLEQRPIGELSREAFRPQVLRGLWTGMALFAAIMLLIVISNGWRFTGYGSIGDMIATFGLMTALEALEELLFRGVLFRILEEWAGTVLALVVSGLVFGGLHLLNPGATLWGALAIALEAGALLGAAYVATRNLWVPIGLHLGWNFAESGIFGATTSGSGGTVGGLLTGVPHGPAIVSGGSFGPQGQHLLALAAFLPPLMGNDTRLGELPVRPLDALGVVAALTMSLPLAFRRLAPAVTLAVVTAGFVVQELRGYATFASLGLVIALFSAAAHQVRFRPAVATAATVVYAGLAWALHEAGSTARRRTT